MFFTTTKMSRSDCLGLYVHEKRRIEVNMPRIRSVYKRWRRKAVAVWLHEFTHFLQWTFKPSDGLVCIYERELVAHRVQILAERLMGLGAEWPTPEEGATASVSWVARRMIDAHIPFWETTN